MMGRNVKGWGGGGGGAGEIQVTRERKIWFLTQLPKMLTQYGIQVSAEDSRWKETI
jgi:hypothetical protein